VASPADLHPLVVRQLRRLGLAAGQGADAAGFDTLLARLSAVLADVDRERYLLQRSQDIASEEMAALNQALRASQARLASLLSLSSDWVWEQNLRGRFTHLSDALAQRTGPDQVILLGQAIGVDGPLRAAPDELARLRRQMAAREPFHDLAFEVTAADGRALHMSISGEPVFDGPAFKGWRGVGSDVTAAVEADRKSQQLARRRLQAQLDFTARLLEVSPTPLFVKDTQGRFVMVNPAWLMLMGLTQSQVIGTTSADLFGGEAPKHSAYDDGLLHSEDSVRYDNRLERPGRPPRDTVVTKVRFTQDDGSPAGIIGSIIDVTEFREAERAIREARDTAENANRTKSEFIANISHELRTPLQSIVGYSELGAVRAKDHPRWHGMFKDIHAGGQRMLTLVNELLDLSKAGNLTASLVLRRHDLATLADEVARELWPLANQRGVAIALRPVAQPLWVLADAFRMQQVIRNVLANALRFAPPASQIEVTGRALAPAEGGGCELVVRDHGPGVPPGELETIFDAFVQSSRTRDGSGGTGLGLTICRKIMAALGGGISAANAADGGAVMTIRLPALPVLPADGPPPGGAA